MTGALISTSGHGDFTVAAINVDIDLANAAQLHEELARAAGNDTRGLVVDLTDVHYVDSAGVRTFFDLARALAISRQQLGIVVPADSPIRRLVKITRLDEAAVLSTTVDDCARAMREAQRPQR